MWSRFKTFDPWLFLAPTVLICVSTVVIYALTVDTLGSSLPLRQSIFAIVAIVVMLALAFFDYRVLKGIYAWIYGATLALLLAVRFFGRVDFGARRWIDIGSFQLQPGEFAKLIIILTIAAIVSQSALRVRWRYFLLALLAIGIPVVLVLLQPDLGTAIVIAVSGIGTLLYARLQLKQRLVILGIVLAVLGIFGVAFQGIGPAKALLKDYQRNRLISFIYPKRDPSGSGYNVLQSVIAVGSGGLSGKGLGLGSQSQLNFLPVAHADFIYAGISEAWGFVGSLGILALYGIMLARLLQAARIAKDEFGMLLCVGIAIKITVEVLVNIGMNIRLMPVTGIPLPFLSYGGTTLLTNAICIGLAQSIVIRYKRLTFA